MPFALGVDFGTTNSVIAFADAAGAVRTLSWPSESGPTQTFRTALTFWREGRGLGHVAGPQALERALAGQPGERFIQSFKTHLGARAFTEARLFGQKLTLEDMTAAFLRHMFEPHGGVAQIGSAYVCAGRPVVFAGERPDEALAQERLERAYAQAGFGALDFAYEPLGAAYWHARRQQREETVLVADFGGGTSDFSILRFERGAVGLEAFPLAHGGCGVAGDSFDFRLIDHAISPRLGKGASYRSLDKLLPLPAYFHATFAQWSQISWLNTPRTLSELRHFAAASERGEELENLAALIEMNLGFALYQTVGAVKAALSGAPTAPLVFDQCGVKIATEVTRADFETWIAPDLARIELALEQTLAQAKCDEGAIDAVFMTGGTSYVPALRSMFEQRFGARRLHFGNPFQSVAAGLALLAADRRRRAE